MPFFFSSFIFLLDSLANPQKLVYIPPFFSPQELRAFRQPGPKRCTMASLLSSSFFRVVRARVRSKWVPKNCHAPPKKNRFRSAHARAHNSKKRAFSCMDKKMKKAHARGGISRKTSTKRARNNSKKRAFSCMGSTHARRGAQEAPRPHQDRPKRPQEAPKRLPRRPQDHPKSIKTTRSTKHKALPQIALRRKAGGRR